MNDALRDATEDEIAHPRGSVIAAIRALALTPGQRVLDVGCGPGAHLGLFADAVVPGGQVVGYDLRPERLTLAAALHAGRVADGTVALREGDLHALPGDLRGFDLVWASLVLYHEPEPVAALRELARAARPEGRVAILDGDGGGSFPVAPWPPELEQRLREAGLRGHQSDYAGTLPYHFSGYTGRHLPRFLREAGLTDVALHAFADVDRAPLRPQREAAVRDWFLNSFGAWARPFLAPHDWERFVAHVTAGSPDDLLTSPDFFVSRTWFLAVGQVRE